MNAQVSECVRSIHFSAIRRMGMLAAKYENVISLGIGEPDFDTPEEVCRTALEDAVAGHTHYAHSQGDPELRAAIAASLKDGEGFEATPERVLVTHGGMNALACAMRALLESGDEVLLPEPHFPDYRAHITFAGGCVVHVPSYIEDGFVVRPEEVEKAVTPKSRILLLNSPCNPTGGVIPRATLEKLADIARRHNLIVVSDEVYDRLVYGEEHVSIASLPGMAERSLVIRSFSKSHAMTGWRIGYGFGPEWIIKEMLKVVSYTTAGANSVGQRAALAALTCDQTPFETFAAAYRARCELAYERLAAMPGVQVCRPRGSFYLFPDISAINPDCEAFALDLLDQKQVVVIPGTSFGPSGGRCVRIACTVGEARLAEAMDRIESFIRERA